MSDCQVQDMSWFDFLDEITGAGTYPVSQRNAVYMSMNPLLLAQRRNNMCSLFGLIDF